MEDEGSRVSCVIAMILTAFAVLLPFIAWIIMAVAAAQDWDDALR
jgi:hypothetical protein